MKSLESSFVVMLRALIMLSCLIVAPLAAIFGSDFPQVVKCYVVDRIFPPQQKSARAVSDDEPAPGALRAPAHGRRDLQRGQSNERDVPRLAAVPPGHAESERGRTAVFHEPADGAPPTATRPTSGHVRGDYREQGPYHRDAGASAERAPAELQPVQPAPAASRVDPDRFATLERKLRGYGATYYLLETLGSGGELFRFHCKMAAANDPARERQFEATDPDAARAMAKVVEQVEAWREQRLQ